MLIKLPSGLRICVYPSLFSRFLHRDLTIRSGNAFHPRHVTSRLCLELLDHALESGACIKLLDVGCGSGILALAGASMGIPVAVGLDIDPRAVLLSRENAQRNRLVGKAHWFVGTVEALQGRFDCIIANLPFEAILDNLDDLARLLESKGRLILSGFQDIQWHVIHDELARRGMSIDKTCSGDLSFYGVPPSGSFTWMAVRARKTKEVEA